MVEGWIVHGGVLLPRLALQGPSFPNVSHPFQLVLVAADRALVSQLNTRAKRGRKEMPQAGMVFRFVNRDVCVDSEQL